MEGHQQAFLDTVHRPAVSRDGRVLAAIGRDDYVRFFERDGSHMCLRALLLLPKELQQMVSRLTVVKLSPDCPGVPRDPDSSANMPLPLLLLSDGDRLVVLDSAMCREGLDGSRGNQDAYQCCIVADYHLGDRFGKLTCADFLLDRDHVLVCFELGAYASILSLTKLSRDDISDVKFNDSQGLALSPGNLYAALLLRVKGHDRVAILTLNDNDVRIQKTFSANTADAQGLLWAPNSDPVLAVWDSAAYGVKVHFFSALGHPLKQLDLSGLPKSSIAQGVGVTSLSWASAGSNTILAVADGHKQTHIRGQDNKNMAITTPMTVQHPAAIDGSKAIVWQQDPTAQATFSLQKGAFDTVIQDDDSGDTRVLEFNADRSFVATVLMHNARTIWLWQPEHPDPHTVLCFHHAVRQVLWHPAQPHVLLIVTTQKLPVVYVWHSETRPPASCNVPLGDTTSTRLEASWLGSTDQGRHPLLVTTAKAFTMGLLQEEDGTVRFLPMFPSDDGLALGEDLDMTEEISTPSRPARNREIAKSLKHSQPAGHWAW